jgi:Uma2 family endonuclease
MHTRLYLTPADHGRALSWDDFASADAEEGFRYEMIEGRVFVSPAANSHHEDYIEWLKGLLRAYALEWPTILESVRGTARVFLPDLAEGITAPEPDIACYAEYAERFATEVDYRDYSPILVVEVISADSADKDLVRNRRLYLQVPSIREYWILDPRQGVEGLTLLVYRRRGRRWAACLTVGAGGTYTTPMLPGFSLVLDPQA